MGTNKTIQFASGSVGSEVLMGHSHFVYDYTSHAVGLGTTTSPTRLWINSVTNAESPSPSTHFNYIIGNEVGIRAGTAGNTRSFTGTSVGTGFSFGNDLHIGEPYETVVGIKNSNILNTRFSVGTGGNDYKTSFFVSSVGISTTNWNSGGVQIKDTEFTISGSNGKIITGITNTKPSHHNNSTRGQVASLAIYGNGAPTRVSTAVGSQTTFYISIAGTGNPDYNDISSNQINPNDIIVDNTSLFTEHNIVTKGIYVFGGNLSFLSDIRHKKDINEIKIEDATKLIKEVKPVTYRWDTEDNKSFSSGFIAQDFVKAGFHHIISAMPNDEIKEYIDGDIKFNKGYELTVDYLKVIPYQSKVIEYLLDKVEKLVS